MNWMSRLLFHFCLLLTMLFGLGVCPSGICPSLWAQNNNNNNNNNSTYAGVVVNAQGVLSRDASLDFGPVNRQQIEAARATYSHLPQNIQNSSKMRFVSINRLEKAIQENQGIITEEMKFLAGIQRITNLFFFPESGDIVIAGPAEGWFPGYEGMMIGRTSGMPVCELQDLVVALRAFAPGKEGASIVGCSIDPTQEGNANMQRFINDFGRNDGPGRRQAFVAGLRKSLGLQTVRVDGISASTHAAVIMVAADYRMKGIGIGVDSVPNDVRIQSFIANVNPSRRSNNNALYRWFFVPDYDSVLLTEDRTGMQLSGAGVRLLAEDEVVAETGERQIQAGKIDPASRKFAASFTDEYAKLARKSPVFAQLRNFIDMLVCAAHIQNEDFYGKSGWKMETFGNEQKFATQTFNTPTHVEPVVGYAERGRTFMAPIGGGVEIEPQVALNKKHAKIDTDGKITKLQSQLKLDLAPGIWWWDQQIH
ncbi:MAG: DUF1598 domain-containing protein [Thermoguttaceae bacterium]